MPCDEDGNFLPSNTLPFPYQHVDLEDWTSYESQLQFEIAKFLFIFTQMSVSHIDTFFNF